MTIAFRAKNLPRYVRQSRLLRHWIRLKALGEPCLQVPGHLRLIEGLFLFDQARKVGPAGVVVEIGSFRGRSAAFMGAALSRLPGSPRLYAVDPFTGATMPYSIPGNSTLEDFKRNTSRYADTIVLCQGFSFDVVKKWQLPIDFLWIDGDHTFEGCGRDIQDWVPFVKSGGMVAFHDYGNPCGVKEAVEKEFHRFERPGTAGVNGSIYYARKA